MNPTKLWNLKKFIDHGVWDQETTFEPIEPVGVSCHKSRTLAPIFTNKTSFPQLSWDKCDKIMKPQKIYWPISLGPRNYIWANWGQKAYPTKSAEPWLQFSQKRPHFFNNHEINVIKSWNLKKFIDLGVLGLETTFGPHGPEDISCHKSRNIAPIFTKKVLFFSRIIRWIKSIYKMS